MDSKQWQKLLHENRLNEKTTYNTKADALNSYLHGDISADEVIKTAKDVFGTEVASKQELTSFLKNKFMQDVMADEYDIAA